MSFQYLFRSCFTSGASIYNPSKLGIAITNINASAKSKTALNCIDEPIIMKVQKMK